MHYNPKNAEFGNTYSVMKIVIAICLFILMHYVFCVWTTAILILYPHPRLNVIRRFIEYIKYHSLSVQINILGHVRRGLSLPHDVL